MSDTEQVTQALSAIQQQLARARLGAPPSVPVQLRKLSVDQSVNHILQERRLDGAQVTADKSRALAAALRAVTLDGVVAEFGVFQGVSLTQIARFFEGHTVHGFDSFTGLPESWSGTGNDQGAFNIGGTPPELPVSNVEFHVGFFEQTVPSFGAQHQGPFAFVHLDADLYSSTKTVMDTLFEWFVPGTVIVFDEYYGYHGWQHHEHKAFMEFLDRSGLSFQGISIGHMNLGVRLVEP